MQNWQILALVAPIFFVLYQALSKLLPKGTSIFLMTSYVFFTSAVVLLVMHLLLSPNKALSMGSRTVWITVAIGVLMGLGNLAIIRAYTLGAPQSGFTALFNPIYVVYGLIAGLIIWHEKLNLPQIGGMVLSIIGIILVSYFKTA